jgi:hypothetical protein
MRRVVLLLLALALICSAFGQKTFSEVKFFAAIASEDLALVDNQINVISKSSIKERDAYVGALLMKKAGLVSPLRDKLESFKEGHSKLQKAINNDPTNAIYRFLRLIIQENAPGILNYNDDIDEDSRYISEEFDTLSPTRQSAVMDYGKKSKALRIEKNMKYAAAKT